jgi:hypothetical protein
MEMMMKKAATVLAMALGLTALVAQAGIVDLNLGNNSFRGVYTDSLSNVLPGTTNGQFDLGLLAKPRESDDFYQAHVGLLLTGDVGTKGVNLAAGLGGRLLFVHQYENNGGGLALGGMLEARLPQYNRFGLNVSSYFAPNPVTFGRLDRSWENTIDLDYELIRGGNVYVGYRNLRQDIAGVDQTTDSGFHVGFRLAF